MSFEWINGFLHSKPKAEDYAQKTLAAYRLGMRAGGSIRGVRIVPGEGCCQAASQLSSSQVYDPDEAPQIPLPGCPLEGRCPCVYRPVMKYEQEAG
jgi:hypothetical protein